MVYKLKFEAAIDVNKWLERDLLLNNVIFLDNMAKSTGQDFFYVSKHDLRI